MPHNPQDALSKPWVQELLSQPILARLATANAETGQPHVTPVWFDWDGEFLTISVFISTRKGREVTKNQRISVLIDLEKPTRAVLLEGAAEVLVDPAQVAPLSEALYARYVGQEAVKSDPYQSWVHDAENRVIKLKPEKAFAWAWE